MKLRGQRIELTEIEHQVAVASFKGLKQNAVEVIPTADLPESQQRLAVFLHLNRSNMRDKPLPRTDALQEELLSLQMKLMSVLPPYMVPSIFIPVFDVPTTTSGKLDRRSLRRLAASFDSVQLAWYSLETATKRVPSTPMEKRLLAVWVQVLGRDDIGADDHFFRSGGDSVAAMRLVAAAREANINIAVSMIFNNPQLSSMAKVAKDLNASTSFSIIPEPFSLSTDKELLDTAVAQCELRRDQIDDIYPATSLQEGLIAISTTQPGTYLNQVVFRLPGYMSIDLFRNAWAKVVAKNSILRTRLVSSLSHGTFQVVVRKGQD